MRLIRLKLSNYRLYRDAEVTFPAGIIGLLGTNAIGKTTLVEAMEWALYGSKVTRGTTKSLRWAKAAQGEIAAVEFEFQHGGRTWIVKRDEKGAKILLEGVVHTVGADAVTKEVEATVLKMTHPEFRAIYFCAQDDLNRLGKMGPTERTQFVLRVTQVEQIDIAIEAGRQHKKVLSDRTKALSEGLGARDPLQGELDAAEAALTELEDQTVRARGALAEAQAQESALHQSFQVLEQARQLNEAAQTRLNGARAERAQAVEALEAFKTRRTRLEALQAELQTKRAKLEEYADDDLVAALAKADRVQDFLTDWNGAKSAKMAQALLEVQAAEKEVSKAQRRIAAVHEAGPEGRCPTCTQTLEDHFDDVIVELEREQLGAEQRLSDARQAVEKLRTDPDEHGTRLEAAKAQAAAALAAIRTRATEAAGLAAEIRGIERQISDVQQDLWGEDKAQERVRDALAEEDRAAEAWASLGEFDAGKHQTVQKAVEEAGKAHTAAERQVSILEAVQLTASSRVDRARAALEQYDARAGQLDVLKARTQQMIQTVDELILFRREQADAMRPEIEERTTKYVSLLSDGRYPEVHMDESFGMILVDGDQEMEVVSGGSDAIAAIALRLALGELVAERAGAPLTLLVFDEPFASLATQWRENVVSLLRTRQDQFQQVILISHHSEMHDAMDFPIQIEFVPAGGYSQILNQAAA